jgi:glutamate/tyrosine decarboxylase-like PLP-dependent enzyme
MYMTWSFEIVKENCPSMWLHIDAAWAGVTLACPEYRETAQLPGINEYADSLCINFHKVTRPHKSVVLIHDSIDLSGSGA